MDGTQPAKPRVVANARPILEMSYREACALAELGAKVLHPKTLRPLMQSGIPLSIRNTFAPDRPGTKITRQARAAALAAKELLAKTEASRVKRGPQDCHGAMQNPVPLGSQVSVVLD